MTTAFVLRGASWCASRPATACRFYSNPYRGPDMGFRTNLTWRLPR
jgi:hypothetical protein